MSGPWEKFQQKPAPKPWERFKSAAPELSAREEFDALPWYSQAGQAADDTMRFLANGMTLGYADKIAGYLGGEGEGAERAKTGRAKERAGAAGTAAEILGTMAPANALMSSALSASRLVPAGLTGAKGLAARSTAMGADMAGLGAIQATGNNEDPLTGALIGFGSGVGGNLAGEALTAGASKAFGMFNPKPKIMTPEQMKAAGEAAYKSADDAGVIFKPESVGRLRDQVYDDFAEFGFHPKNHPGAGVAYDELARLAEGGNVSLKGLDTARKVTQGGFKADNPANNALIGKAAERIDDFAMGAGADDVLSGNPQVAAKALKEARTYWQRFRKSEKVNELLERAAVNAGSTGSGGNVENATRQQLKRLLTDKKLTRGMTPDELSAVKKAVLGTPTQNALRLAGKLSPQGNGLMLYLMGAGSVAAPHVTIPAMAAGYGAKKTAEALTRKSAADLQKLIAVGGSKSALQGPKNALQKLTESQRETLVRLLSASGLVAAGQQ